MVRTVAVRPKVLLDEPLSNLAARMLRSTLGAVVHEPEKAMTISMSPHSLWATTRCCCCVFRPSSTFLIDCASP
jgi:hypothetical protein